MLNGARCEKTWFCIKLFLHIPTTKDFRFCRSDKHYLPRSINTSSCHARKFKPLVSHCGCTGCFKSYQIRIQKIGFLMTIKAQNVSISVLVEQTMCVFCDN